MANITYVDENDNIIGSGSQKEAREKGIIHRVSRVFIFNSKGELLLQKRGPTLSSNPNKWNESAAGHVDEGEDYHETAVRELEEEMGIRDVPLTEIAKFYYEEKDEKWNRRRWNVLYTGTYEGNLILSPREVSEAKWIKIGDAQKWVAAKPQEFTSGFLQAFNIYIEKHHE